MIHGMCKMMKKLLNKIINLDELNLFIIIYPLYVAGACLLIISKSLILFIIGIILIILSFLILFYYLIKNRKNTKQ